MSIAVKQWIIGIDDLLWWSSKLVLAIIYCVCAEYPLFIIAAHLGNKVIVYHMSLLTLQLRVFCRVTHAISNHSVPEIRNVFFQTTVTIVSTYSLTLTEWKPEYWLFVPRVEPRTSDLLTGRERSLRERERERVGALTTISGRSTIQHLTDVRSKISYVFSYVYVIEQSVS